MKAIPPVGGHHIAGRAMAWPTPPGGPRRRPGAPDQRASSAMRISVGNGPDDRTPAARPGPDPTTVDTPGSPGSPGLESEDAMARPRRRYQDLSRRGFVW